MKAHTSTDQPTNQPHTQPTNPPVTLYYHNQCFTSHKRRQHVHAKKPLVALVNMRGRRRRRLLPSS